jgi:hypothetical protein
MSGNVAWILAMASEGFSPIEKKIEPQRRGERRGKTRQITFFAGFWGSLRDLCDLGGKPSVSIGPITFASNKSGVWLFAIGPVMLIWVVYIKWIELLRRKFSGLSDFFARRRRSIGLSIYMISCYALFNLLPRPQE